MRPVSPTAYRKLRFSSAVPAEGDRVFLHVSPTGALGRVVSVHGDPYAPTVTIEFDDGDLRELVPRSSVRVVREYRENTMKITRRQLRQIIRESIDRSYPTGPLETLPPLDSVDPGDFTPEPDYLDGWNDAAAGKGYREDASDAYFDGYRDGNDHMLRYDEPPMLEAKLPSRSRMKELKDAAWLATSNILKEGITDITFHKTGLKEAARIIKNNKFMTSVAFGQEHGAGDESPNKGRQYFLSTMRSPTSDRDWET